MILNLLIFVGIARKKIRIEAPEYQVSSKTRPYTRPKNNI
jgi:hypothetical protein